LQGPPEGTFPREESSVLPERGIKGARIKVRMKGGRKGEIGEEMARAHRGVFWSNLGKQLQETAREGGGKKGGRGLPIKRGRGEAKTRRTCLKPPVSLD